ncbi:hypothetical protein Vretimale_4766 [Volvox reticuliferus]|uniref:Uncharacterized protein n=1 Tax=Volvox reticuliferus TaxID=1737510 RepID=A0A8J4DC32_9CHLO|nr:hypothetical protein Vretimale_4766 [Volvox reticuliferus]
MLRDGAADFREENPLEPPTRPPDREDAAKASSGITAPAIRAAATMDASGRATAFMGPTSSGFWAWQTTTRRVARCVGLAARIGPERCSSILYLNVKSVLLLIECVLRINIMAMW